MKQLLITIAAVVLVGCATTQQPEPSTAEALAQAEETTKTSESTDYSGTYTLSTAAQLSFELKPDGLFVAKSLIDPADQLIGFWKVDGELLVIESSEAKEPTKKTVIKFNKTTGKLISVWDVMVQTIDQIPEGEDGLYFKKN